MDRLFVLLKVKPNKLRLKILNLLIKDYTKKSLAKRKGECVYWKCKASCCGPCKYLDENYACTVYNNRPKECYKEAPVDWFEWKWFKYDKNGCGYYWDQKVTAKRDDDS
ncbi:hypothetical protein GF351_02865 [Candidatus Woesearchaeota archaeon]|nr:hypothetical protein [Candidatus Woesearchaeota archaeon]